MRLLLWKVLDHHCVRIVSPKGWFRRCSLLFLLLFGCFPSFFLALIFRFVAGRQIGFLGSMQRDDTRCLLSSDRGCLIVELKAKSSDIIPWPNTPKTHQTKKDITSIALHFANVVHWIKSLDELSISGGWMTHTTNALYFSLLQNSKLVSLSTKGLITRCDWRTNFTPKTRNLQWIQLWGIATQSELECFLRVLSKKSRLVLLVSIISKILLTQRWKIMVSFVPAHKRISSSWYLWRDEGILWQTQQSHVVYENWAVKIDFWHSQNPIQKGILNLKARSRRVP